jgi:hypothetical protein
MTPEDTSKLLAAAAMFDFRKADRDDILMWHHVIGDLDFEDAMEAVKRHYAESTDRMMPAHVRQGVRAIRNERAAKNHSEPLALPSRFEDDEDRTDRARRGSAQAHEVIAELARRMQERADGVPDDAMARLRELTDGEEATR